MDAFSGYNLVVDNLKNSTTPEVQELSTTQKTKLQKLNLRSFGPFKIREDNYKLRGPIFCGIIFFNIWIPHHLIHHHTIPPCSFCSSSSRDLSATMAASAFSSGSRAMNRSINSSHSPLEFLAKKSSATVKIFSIISTKFCPSSLTYSSGV